MPEEHAPARLWSSRSSVQPPLPLQTLLRPLRRPRRWSDARSALECQDTGTLLRIQRLHNELTGSNWRTIGEFRSTTENAPMAIDQNPNLKPIKVKAPATAMLVGRETFGREDLPPKRARAAPHQNEARADRTRPETSSSSRPRNSRISDRRGAWRVPTCSRNTQSRAPRRAPSSGYP